MQLKFFYNSITLHDRERWQRKKNSTSHKGGSMKHFTPLLAVLSLFLIAACASVEEPKPDPVKEEISILQKQLLELQKLQNETKSKLDESNATVNALSVKIQALEERQTARVVTQAQIDSKPTTKTPAAAKKKTKKVKKKVRRQE